MRLETCHSLEQRVNLRSIFIVLMERSLATGYHHLCEMGTFMSVPWELSRILGELIHLDVCRAVHMLQLLTTMWVWGRGIIVWEQGIHQPTTSSTFYEKVGLARRMKEAGGSWWSMVQSREGATSRVAAPQFSAPGTSFDVRYLQIQVCV